jgi:hypothetical protein
LCLGECIWKQKWSDLLHVVGVHGSSVRDLHESQTYRVLASVVIMQISKLFLVSAVSLRIVCIWRQNMEMIDMKAACECHVELCWIAIGSGTRNLSATMSWVLSLLLFPLHAEEISSTDAWNSNWKCHEIVFQASQSHCGGFCSRNFASSYDEDVESSTKLHPIKSWVLAADLQHQKTQINHSKLDREVTKKAKSSLQFNFSHVLNDILSDDSADDGQELRWISTLLTVIIIINFLHAPSREIGSKWT